MPAIFTENRGVAAAHSVAGLPGIVLMDQWGPGPTFNAVITGFQLGGRGGYQFMHTLRDVIYVYVFGERIGQLGIQGVAFMDGCLGDREGLHNVFEFYNSQRLSTTGKPVMISLGGDVAIKGLLTGFDFQLVDAQFGLGQFTLQLAYPPKNPQ